MSNERPLIATDEVHARLQIVSRCSDSLSSRLRAGTSEADVRRVLSILREQLANLERDLLTTDPGPGPATITAPNRGGDL